MKGFHLSKEEIVELHIAHRQERNKRHAYKIHAIILLGTGYTLKKVKEVLFIDDETLRSYVNAYRNEGVSGLLKDDRGGRVCFLSEEELVILRQELDDNIYLNTASVIAYVSKMFKVTYTPTGMRDLLHRLGYEYKKPKLIPGNPDKEAQELFAEQYQEFMLTKPSDVEVVFVDAVHPEHNSMAGYGWIKRGKNKELRTNSGRQRLNLHGAINAETHEVTIIESGTIDANSTLQLLLAIESKYPMASSIKVILDNAKYHYSNIVRDYVENSRIDLVFLPSYSPNLNLIERLWHFFKKKLLYNTYYENIHTFRKACIEFFRNLDKHQKEIARFMNTDFSLE